MFTVIASCEIVEVVGISITTIQLLFCNSSSKKNIPSTGILVYIFRHVI